MKKLSVFGLEALEFFQRSYFWCTAKNRHGVHSPFVYKLNDECFNAGDLHLAWDRLYPDLVLFFSKNQLEFFHRLMKYFNLCNYCVLKSADKRVEARMCVIPDAFIYTENMFSVLEEDTILLVHNIHNVNRLLWNKLKDHQSVSVSIDLYRQGLIFMNRPQAKQMFKIRLRGHFWVE